MVSPCWCGTGVPRGDCEYDASSPFQLLPTASVGAAIHVKYLSGYLTCTCQVEYRVDNVLYLRDRFHWLHCGKYYVA